MEDNIKRNLLSALIPDEVEEMLGMRKKDEAGSDQAGMLVELLQAAGGAGDSPLREMFSEFLSGQGGLFQFATEAVTRKPASAEDEVAKFLREKFSMNKTAAGLAARLVIKLIPGIRDFAEKQTGKTKPKTTAKKKPAAKKKPLTKKKATAPAAAKAKKKNAAKTTAKKAAAKKTMAKKNTPAKTTQRKTTAKKTTPRKKPAAKKRTRGAEIPLGDVGDIERESN